MYRRKDSGGNNAVLRAVMNDMTSGSAVFRNGSSVRARISVTTVAAEQITAPRLKSA